MSLVTNLNNIFTKGVVGNVRKVQEDSHDMALKTPNGDVFVVCDGMGGHVGGAKASELAVNNIISHLKEEKYQDPINALDGALRRANDQILGTAAANPELKGMGTTACILLMQDDEVWIAHVGDSRIYWYHGEDKRLERITKDHSYVQMLVDEGKITEEEAEIHPNKNRILRALGVTPNLTPSFNEHPIHPLNGDIFLICSDGLSGMIPDSTIERVLCDDTPLTDKGELLIELAMKGETVQPGGQDNCTVELIQIDNSPWTKSESTSDNTSRTKEKDAKQKSLFIVKIVAVFVALLVAVGVGAMFGNKKIKIEKKEERIKANNESISNLRIDSTDKEESITEINEKLLEAQKDYKKAQDQDSKKVSRERIKSLEEKKSSLESDLARIKTKIDSLDALNQTLREELKKI